MVAVEAEAVVTVIEPNILVFIEWPEARLLLEGSLRASVVPPGRQQLVAFHAIIAPPIPDKVEPHGPAWRRFVQMAILR